MKKLLCPSMMCANFATLGQEIEALEAAGSDILHIDIMDGSFVPNFGMGLQDTELIIRQAQIPVDVHLMIQNPGAYVARFAQLGADIIYIHAEADIHAPRTLQAIIDAGATPAIAINPATSAESIRLMLPMVKYVLVMTVNPGYAGQKYLQFVDEKIDTLLDWQSKYGYHIMIDGACSPEVIQTLGAKGVEGFVLGTSALFGKGRPYSELMQELRAL